MQIPGSGWQQRAAASYDALVQVYWSERRGRFRACSGWRPFGQWYYWWQAHALVAVTDAAVRTGDDREVGRAAALVAGIHRRNGATLANDYYDDMAWLALALLHAQRRIGLRTGALVDQLWDRIRFGYDDRVGAVVWRRGDDYFNVPTNGPVALLAARLGELDLARGIGDWLHATLVEDGRVFDGIHYSRPPAPPGTGRLERTPYTYNYGTVLGADLALHAGTGDPGHLRRAGQVAGAVRRDLTAAGSGADGGAGGSAGAGAAPLLPAEGGGDRGLFKGILAGHLADYVAVTGDAATRDLLRANGDRAWQARDPRGLSGPDWSRPAGGPVDLSAHLSGVLLFAALAALDRLDAGP